jgi:predicted amidohydrolase
MDGGRRQRTRFPDVAERAASDGCRVYLASSALDADNDSFEQVYPVRAREFGLYVVLANLVGPSEAGPCAGRSGVWGPDGERIADAGPDQETLALAEVG